jgi:hypothetical protein
MQSWDLLDELWTALAVRKQSPAIEKWLYDQGMTERSMRFVEPGPIGVGHITESESGFYEPADAGHGPPMLIIPAYEGEGPERLLVDLVAVNAHKPTQWYQRTGAAVFLGHNLYIQVALDNVPLYLCETPLDYLLSNGSKVCPLDLDHLPLFLQDFKEVRTDNIEFGRIIERKLNPRPPRTPIVKVANRHA